MSIITQEFPADLQRGDKIVIEGQIHRVHARDIYYNRGRAMVDVETTTGCSFALRANETVETHRN